VTLEELQGMLLRLFVVQRRRPVAWHSHAKQSGELYGIIQLCLNQFEGTGKQVEPWSLKHHMMVIHSSAVLHSCMAKWCHVGTGLQRALRYALEVLEKGCDCDNLHGVNSVKHNRVGVTTDQPTDACGRIINET
jgi:hypothetical protein